MKKSNLNLWFSADLIEFFEEAREVTLSQKVVIIKYFETTELEHFKNIVKEFKLVVADLFGETYVVKEIEELKEIFVLTR